MKRNWGGFVLLTSGVMAALCSSARAGAGEGIRLGDGGLLTPYAEGQVIYDDNVVIAEDGQEQSDSALFGKLGVDLFGKSDKASLKANAWASTTDYQDMSEEDHDDYSLNAALSFGSRDQMLMTLGAGFNDIQGVEYSSSAIEHCKTTAAKVGLGRNVTDKMDCDINYDFSDSNYVGEPSRDWTQQKAMLELAYQITDKSAALANGTYGTQSSDSNANDADFVEVRGGLKTKNTDKVQGRASVGYRQQMTDPVDPTVDDTISGASYEVAADWQFSERVLVKVAGGNAIYPSRLYDDNYAWETTVKATLRWSIGDTLTADIMGQYRQWDLNDPVIDPTDHVLKDKTIDTVTGILRLTYQTRAKFLAVYAEGQYEDSSSSFDYEDYTQMLAIAGLRLSY